MKSTSGSSGCVSAMAFLLTRTSFFLSIYIGLHNPPFRFGLNVDEEQLPPLAGRRGIFYPECDLQGVTNNIRVHWCIPSRYLVCELNPDNLRSSSDCDGHQWALAASILICITAQTCPVLPMRDVLRLPPRTCSCPPPPLSPKPPPSPRNGSFSADGARTV